MKYLLIPYLNRSGSTFLLNNLSRHPKIIICPEAEILVYLFLKFPEKLADQNYNILNDNKLRHWNFNYEDLKKIYCAKNNLQIFLNFLFYYKEKNNKQAELVVFKAVELIDIIKKISFENYLNYHITLLFLIRDCRAIFNSQKNTYYIGTKNKMSNNAIVTSLKWKKFINIKNSLNLKRNSAINYEKLVTNFEQELDILFKKLKLNTQELNSKPEYVFRIPKDQLIINPDINKEPIIENIYKWKEKLNKYDVKLIQLITKKQLLNEAYPIFRVEIKHLLFIFYIIKSVIKYLIKGLFRRIFSNKKFNFN